MKENKPSYQRIGAFDDYIISKEGSQYIVESHKPFYIPTTLFSGTLK